MGCLYVLGIPVYEDSECAEKRRNDRTDRKDIEEASDVEKNASNNERKTLNTALRNADGESAGQELFQGVGSAASGALGGVAGIYSSVFSNLGLGGLLGGAPGQSVDLTPVLLIGGAAVVGFMVLRR